MPPITQTSNVNGVWNGTIPGSADATITHFKLYASSTVDQVNNYRLVTQVVNPGAGPITLGPLTYAQLFLQVPNRPFYLKATKVQSGKESDLSNATESPSLLVNPTEVIGWTLAQVLEQGFRPVVIVGYDPVNKLFYPLNVVPSGTGTGYKLET